MHRVNMMMQPQQPPLVNSSHHPPPPGGPCPPPQAPPPSPLTNPPQQPSTSHLRAVLSQRIKLLQCQLQASPPLSSPAAGASGVKSSRQLPCIEEAWNMPVSQEMASRQQSLLQRGSYNLAVQRAGQIHPSNHFTGSVINGPISNGTQEKPAFYLNVQDMQILQQLQTNVANLNPQQRSLMVSLQGRHRLMVQHKNQLQHQLAQQQQQMAQQQLQQLVQQQMAQQQQQKLAQQQQQQQSTQQDPVQTNTPTANSQSSVDQPKTENGEPFAVPEPPTTTPTTPTPTTTTTTSPKTPTATISLNGLIKEEPLSTPNQQKDESAKTEEPMEVEEDDKVSIDKQVQKEDDKTQENSDSTTKDKSPENNNQTRVPEKDQTDASEEKTGEGKEPEENIASKSGSAESDVSKSDQKGESESSKKTETANEELEKRIIETTEKDKAETKLARTKKSNDDGDEDDDTENTVGNCLLKRSELDLMLRTEHERAFCRKFVNPFQDFSDSKQNADDLNESNKDEVVDHDRKKQQQQQKQTNRKGEEHFVDPKAFCENRVPTEMMIDRSADDIMNGCKKLFSKYGVPAMSITHGYGGPPPQTPARPAQLPKDRLQPAAPSVFLENKKQAFTLQLQQFCNSNPITVVRNLGSVLKLDLGLFSTKCLVDANPDHPVEVRTQLNQGLDENWDSQRRAQVWRCDSVKSRSTIARYAQYQTASFQEQLREEQKKRTSNPPTHLSDSDSNSSLGVFSVNKSKRAKKNTMFKTLKFGSHVDLNDEKRWRVQLQELSKLPPFTKVVSGCNMLSHIGRQIVGVNTVKLHLKVPGARTTGHQEHNNFCSVNMNIGPGDCEWFATPYEYWGEVYKLCERAHVKFNTDSWWPLMEDLMNQHVPVYRFIQRPGDLVYVNYGTVHWVHSTGWCNNISWNVAPISADQYQLAIERYEWNKLHTIKSMVPMQQLTWNLARNMQFTDERLYKLVRGVLSRSLRNCGLQREWLQADRKEIRWHGKARTELTYYCNNCQSEVFNILYSKNRSDEPTSYGTSSRNLEVYCFHCARSVSSGLQGFTVLEEYSMNDLKDVYDHFQLREMLPPPSSSISSGLS